MAKKKGVLKLAVLLGLRKELQAKVDQLNQIKNADVYRLKAKRVPAQDGLDDLTMEVPLLCAAQVTAEYDFYAKKLRLTDMHIQQTNWETDVVIEDDIINREYTAPKLKRGKDDSIA